MNSNTLFIIFSSLLVICTLTVSILKHPVFYLLSFFVGCFICSPFLLSLLDCTFLASPLIWIYIGAIAVLFLSVIMMIDTTSIHSSKFYNMLLKIIQSFQRKKTVLLEDDVKFHKFYKKKFPILYYLLPFIRFVSLFFMFYQLKLLNVDFASRYLSIINFWHVNAGIKETGEQNLILFYRSYYICLSLALLTFLLDIYVIFNANSPIENKAFKVISVGGGLLIATTGLTGLYANSPMVTPDGITNFYQTKTCLGNGYDYTPGSSLLKLKGDVATGCLGKKKMLEGFKKYADDSMIVNQAVLNNVLREPDNLKVLNKELSFLERIHLGIVIPGWSASLHDSSDVVPFKGVTSSNSDE